MATMNTFVAFKPDRTWAIVLASRGAVARFAAEELRRTLQRCGLPALPIVEAHNGPQIALECGADGDGFGRRWDGERLILYGHGPRGLLYAVYDLLETLGCAWVSPDPSGEWLPREQALQVPREALASGPQLARRSLIIGDERFLRAAPAWIVWAARNRLNTIFVHVTASRPTVGAARLRTWRAMRKHLLPLLAERGLRLELGGHLLNQLLPRQLFGEQPTWFRFDGQRRTPDYNLCPSSAGLAYAAEQAAAFAARYPEADSYHLWPADLATDDWCRCPLCAALSPSEQALRVSEALATAIAAVRPNAQVAHLAYHSSQRLPRAPKPSNLDVLVALRRRSYAAGIAGNQARNHADYADVAHAAALAGPERVQLFEYYADGILFKGAPPPLGTVIQADMQAFSALGVGGAGMLLTDLRSPAASGPNPYLFARFAWDSSQDRAACFQTYANVLAPAAPQQLVAAWHALEQAWHGLLDLQPNEAGSEQPHQPNRLDRALIALCPPLRAAPVSAPPSDILDIAHTPARLAEQRLASIDHGSNALAACSSALAELHAAHVGAAAARVQAETSQIGYGIALLRYLRARQAWAVRSNRKAPRSSLARDLASLDELVRSAAAGAEASLLPFLLRAQHEYLADQRSAPLWQRLALRLNRFAALVRLAFNREYW